MDDWKLAATTAVKVRLKKNINVFVSFWAPLCCDNVMAMFMFWFWFSKWQCPPKDVAPHMLG